jgi:predicted alpha/beta superfamily hydrolase
VNLAAANVRVHYPLASGRLVLRAEPDWTHDIKPVSVDSDSARFEFSLAGGSAFRYFKPVLLDAGERWAIGANSLWLADRPGAQDCYPFFNADEHCSECELLQLADSARRRHRFRVFYPPGYHENPLRRYPVLYMQDGQNLFFPGEAFGHQHWRIAETLRLLDRMNAIDQVIVVGIYPNERESDYTRPGYESYGRFLVETLKPYIDDRYRTLAAARHTAVMGSSLGGVVSLYAAWQHPEVFGAAACMSSTFGWRDDLTTRIATEPARDVQIYLDSGWPNDNYEATRHMHSLLASRGYRDGHNLHYYSFPQAAHDEHHWAMRAHLPLQLFFSAERRSCINIS